MRIFSVNRWRFAATIGVGKWDRFTSTGVKHKQGDTEVVFNEETLGQMIDNFAARKNDLALCYDHQSAYVEVNGQPAPALAWYCALALVIDGAVAKFSTHDPAVQPPDPKGLEDGVYGYRSEVTPLGEKLLPNYRYISPLFTDQGADEEGNPIGYDLMDVAATNTPFQDGVGLTFHRLSNSGPGPQETLKMDELKKFLGLAADATDKDVAEACMKRMKKYEDDAAEMKKKFDAKDGDPDLDDKKLDDAEVMADDGDDASAMQKMAKALGFSGSASPAKMHAALSAKMVPMSDVAKVQQELASLKQRLEDEKKAEADKLFAVLADKAIAAGYDEKKREKFIAYARQVGADEAEEFVKTLPGKTALKRFTRGGNPVAPTNSSDKPGVTDGIDPDEIGAELATKARKYAKENKVTLQQAYIALGRFDNSYAESLDRLRGYSRSE